MTTADEAFAAAWEATAAAVGLAAETTERLGRELLDRHREPQRHYHTVEHVLAVLDGLDRLDARNPVTELAAFFHDAIYDPTAGDNEERSADLAAAWLVGIDEVDAVVDIVLATAGHQPPAGSGGDLAAFLDADLAVLGADQPTYDAYARGIGAEYAHRDEASFREGRATILEGFVGRERLFVTDRGHELWDAAARRNLRREIRQLREY